MAVQSTISAPLVTVEPALSTPEALGMGRCGQRRKLLQQVVVGVGAGLHHSPLWEDAASFSPSNVHRQILSPKGSCQAHGHYTFSLHLDLC